MEIRSNRLLAEESELLKRTVLDCNDVQYDRGAWRCVLLRESTVANGDAGTDYFALLVRPVSCEKTACAYKRAGAGILSSSHFSADIADGYMI